jgi:hypothetical protein
MIHIITFDKDYKQDIYRMEREWIPDRIFEGNFERLFARCKKCLWSATIFKSKAQKSVIALGTCPTCFDENIRLIPLVYVRPM